MRKFLIALSLLVISFVVAWIFGKIVVTIVLLNSGYTAFASDREQGLFFSLILILTLAYGYFGLIYLFDRWIPTRQDVFVSILSYIAIAILLNNPFSSAFMSIWKVATFFVGWGPSVGITIVFLKIVFPLILALEIIGCVMLLINVMKSIKRRGG